MCGMRNAIRCRRNDSWIYIARMDDALCTGMFGARVKGLSWFMGFISAIGFLNELLIGLIEVSGWVIVSGWVTVVSGWVTVVSGWVTVVRGAFNVVRGAFMVPKYGLVAPKGGAKVWKPAGAIGYV